MSSVSYRCIEQDKGVVLCGFIQDNTNLGYTLQSAINLYFTDLRNNVILHLQQRDICIKHAFQHFRRQYKDLM